MFQSRGFELLGIHRAFHEIARTQHGKSFELAALSFASDFAGDVQPGTRRTVFYEIEGLVNRVIGTDQEVGAPARQLFR